MLENREGNRSTAVKCHEDPVSALLNVSPYLSRCVEDALFFFIKELLFLSSVCLAVDYMTFEVVCLLGQVLLYFILFAVRSVIW